MTREGVKSDGWRGGGALEEAAVNTVREGQYVEMSVCRTIPVPIRDEYHLPPACATMMQVDVMRATQKVAKTFLPFSFPPCPAITGVFPPCPFSSHPPLSATLETTG